MKLSTMFPSNFLKKDDVPRPIVATMDRVEMMEIGDDGQKPVLSFQDDQLKSMVLNVGNATIIEAAYGDTDDWTGKKIEIYVDPNVMFGGRRVGGLRVRIPDQIYNGHVTESWTWDVALKKAGEWGLTKDDVVAALKSAGHTTYKPERDTRLVQDLISGAGSKETPLDEVVI